MPTKSKKPFIATAQEQALDFQRLIQVQTEKHLQSLNLNNKSLREINDPINSKSLENYSGIFDPEILNILNGVNTTIAVNSKTAQMKNLEELIKPKQEKNQNDLMNTSVYSFIENNSHPPSRGFRCSRQFLDLDGKIIKKIQKRGRKGRNNSYQGFDRKVKKLEKVIRRLSFGNRNTEELIQKKNIVTIDTLKSNAKEINKKFLLREKNGYAKSSKVFKNFDGILNELKQEEILKILNSIEGVIKDGGKLEPKEKEEWKSSTKL